MAINRAAIEIKARTMSEGVQLNISGMFKFPTAEERRANEVRTQDIIAETDFDDPDSLIESVTQVYSIESVFPDFNAATDLILDGSKIAVPLQHNPGSSLVVSQDNGKVVIKKGDQVLATGTITVMGEAWKDTPLSNGMPAKNFLPGMSQGIINVVMSLSCDNCNQGQSCKYCSFYTNALSLKIEDLPLKTLDRYSKLQGEALKVATDNGWRGIVVISGGSFPKSLQSKSMERLELVVNTLRAAVGEDVSPELDWSFNHYPPLDFNDMHLWKKMGITGTALDMEVMDPELFAEICPGKHAYKPLEYWKEAQEAAAEVFGAYVGATTCVVVGLEPMASLLEGFEERLSKRVMPLPLNLWPNFGSSEDELSPPSTEWILEATDKMADLYLKFARPIVTSFVKMVGKKALTRESRRNLLSGKNKNPKSINCSVAADEIVRRLEGKSIGGMVGLLLKTGV